MASSITVKHDVVLDFLHGPRRRYLVVRVDLALELLRWSLVDVYVARYGFTRDSLGSLVLGCSRWSSILLVRGRRRWLGWRLRFRWRLRIARGGSWFQIWGRLVDVGGESRLDRFPLDLCALRRIRRFLVHLVREDFRFARALENVEKENRMGDKQKGVAVTFGASARLFSAKAVCGDAELRH